MRGFVIIVYGIFLLLTGFNAKTVHPAHLSHSPSHHQVKESLTANSDDSDLVSDEIEDEEERTNNALAKRCKLLSELSISAPDLFDLNYLNVYSRDRLPLGDLPDIYIAQRALRI
jgi:hypothetical protein